MSDLTGEANNDNQAKREPTDQPARTRIVSSLDETLFVEAGAGSGKTRSLVDRILELVITGGVPLREIAAITFTEKAAAELRDRIRKTLEQRAADSEQTQAVRARCEGAVADVDSAAISTLHAFAQRILSEHPVQAGLPPAIEVVDEISSQVAFDDRWRDYFGNLLDNPDMEQTLLLAFAAGVGEKHFRDLASAFQDNWDLITDQVPESHRIGDLDVSPIVAALRDVCGQAEHGLGDDNMVIRLADLSSYADQLHNARDDADRLRLLSAAKPSFKVSRVGTAKNWTGEVTIGEVRADIIDIGEARDQLRDHISGEVITAIACALREFTLDDVDDRRRNGRVEFHDLLVFARQLLRDPTEGWQVREALQERYSPILLDEFQDTDPIQIELAVLLASTDPEAGSKDWQDIDVEAGRLFFVGDPKQSIYRFRRADISLFLDARRIFGAGDRTAHLTTNFRTVGPIIDWVNSVFGRLIQSEPGSQPEYQALESFRPTIGRGPAVLVLGAEGHETKLKADEIRDFEAKDVAAAITTVFSDSWQVCDIEADTETWRDARLGDVTILLPARTSLPALERALDDAGLPYRAETSSLVWSTREVRDLMAALRSVDDPTDELSLVTALRSSIYGCGDDDLYTYNVEHGGRWSHQVDRPDDVDPDHPVAVALTHLGELHKARLWNSPSELIERLVRDRRLLELGVTRGRPRDLWRRLRFVVDQARAYGDSAGGNLRQFLHWAHLQSAEGARVAETVLPETDDDSIRIMTVHGSKGLEFPITVLSGLTTQPGGRRGGVQVKFPPGEKAAISLSSNLTTIEYEDYKPIDEQMGHHERLRLLYVAATRARDHLIVSLHRNPQPKSGPKPEDRMTSAELFTKASAAAPVQPDQLAPSASSHARNATIITSPSNAIPSRDDWKARRDAAFNTGTRPRTLAATTIAKRATEMYRDPALDKEPRDLDLPPWNKGRYGTAVGRAVHAVLQTVDLVTGEGLTETARAQAAAEGIIGREDVIADLARSALQSHTVTEAAAGTFWREIYVAAPVDGTTIEGYVDLLYRRDDGLVVVDYKTDAVASAADLDAKLDRYALQGATYALAIEAAVGESVSEMVFVFLARDGAHVRSVPDLAARIAEVRRVVNNTI